MVLNRRQLEAPGSWTITVRASQELKTAVDELEIDVSQVTREALTIAVRRALRERRQKEQENEHGNKNGI